jgi:chromosome segregation ATPase
MGNCFKSQREEENEHSALLKQSSTNHAQSSRTPKNNNNQNRRRETLNRKQQRIIDEHTEELRNQLLEYENEMKLLREKMEQTSVEKDIVIQESQSKQQELHENYQQQIDELKHIMDQSIHTLSQNHQKQLNELQLKVESCEQQISEHENRNLSLESQYETCRKELDQMKLEKQLEKSKLVERKCIVSFSGSHNALIESLADKLKEDTSRIVNMVEIGSQRETGQEEFIEELDHIIVTPSDKSIHALKSISARHYSETIASPNWFLEMLSLNKMSVQMKVRLPHHASETSENM